MTHYRDLLTEIHGTEIGSDVGCGLGRLERKVSQDEIDYAISHYKQHRDEMRQHPIGARRQIIVGLFRQRKEWASWFPETRR